MSLLLVLASTVAIAAPRCEFTELLTAQEGSFTDGSAAAAQYANDQNSCWRVTPTCPEGARLSLWFPRVEVEWGYDYVQLYDEDGVLLGKSVGAGVTYTGSAFTVNFVSDHDIALSGFEARWSCEVLDAEPEDGVDLYRNQNSRARVTRR